MGIPNDIECLIISNPELSVVHWKVDITDSIGVYNGKQSLLLLLFFEAVLFLDGTLSLGDQRQPLFV